MCAAIEIKSTLDECKSLITLIMNHGALLSALRTRSSKVLVKHAVTRFATHYLCVDRLVSCKEAVLPLLVSNQFAQFVTSLPADKRASASSVQQICASVAWFKKIETLRDLMHPFYVFLRDVDGTTPGMAGKVYYRLYVLQEQLSAEGPDSLLFPFSLATRSHVRQALTDRWYSMHSQIYSIGFMLDPEFVDTASYGQYSNTDLMNEWHAFVNAYFPGKAAGMCIPWNITWHMLIVLSFKSRP
jgi:hypothetical protein